MIDSVLKWVELVEERETSSDHAAMKQHGAESRAWVAGEGHYTDEEKVAWKSDLVRGNLWYRDIKIMSATILGQEPVPVVSSTLRDDVYVRASSAVSAMAEKCIAETKLHEEVEAAYLTAKHDNVGFVKLHWDKHRQLPTFRWVEGHVLMDKAGFGMPNRARWMAECVCRPLSEVLQDTTIKLAIRNKLKKQFTMHGHVDYERELRFLYIWSKDGAAPWEKYEGRKYIVLCRDWLDEPICVEDWPWPFLDHDEFPIKILRLEWIPRSFEGVTPFQVVKPLLRQYNWLSSFIQAGVRRELTKKILVNEQSVTNPDALTNGEHLAVVKVSGEGKMRDAIHVVDFTGSGAGTAMDALMLVKAQHDEQTGVTDIARGQSPGNRVTATEARALERNSATVAQQEAKIVDRFYNEIFTTLCMAILYYVPQWSRTVGENEVGKFLKTKAWDGTAVVGIDEMGQLILGAWIEAQVGDEEAAQLPDPNLYEVDYIVRPGVDAWIGDDHAESWVTYSPDQLRRDFSFKIESGSSRAEHTLEQERKATTLMQVMGQILLQFGAFEQYHELVRYFITSMRLPDPQRFIPDRVKFMAGPTFTPQKIMPPNGDKASPTEQTNMAYSQNGTPEPSGRSAAEGGP